MLRKWNMSPGDIRLTLLHRSIARCDPELQRVLSAELSGGNWTSQLEDQSKFSFRLGWSSSDAPLRRQSCSRSRPPMKKSKNTDVRPEDSARSRRSLKRS